MFKIPLNMRVLDDRFLTGLTSKQNYIYVCEFATIYCHYLMQKRLFPFLLFCAFCLSFLVYFILICHIFPHSDWIWRDTPCLPLFSPNAEKCGKNSDENTSKYGHFLRSWQKHLKIRTSLFREVINDFK